jgi:putative ABC transport system substrate-binding protein
MRRRDFITLLGGAMAWPLAAHGQQPAMPVIGFLHPASPEPFGHIVDGFRRGLNDIGFVEGQTSQSNTAGRVVNMSGCQH